MRKLVLGVLVATLALAACGGSDKKTVTPSGGGSTTVSTGANGNGGGGNEFSDLVNKAKTTNYKVTYQTEDGDSQTIAQDGNGKSALITDGRIIISDGTTTISCDGTDSSAKCTDAGSIGKTTLAGMMSIYTVAYTGLSRLRSSAFGGKTTSETIAGRDASCVTFKSSEIGGLGINIPGDPSVTSCVDKEDGYLLKYEMTISGKTTTHFLATAAGESSPSDFEPPSTPETLPTLPTLPGNITIPSIPTP
jgi:outer membrane lipoprotein-sorting protein